MWQARPGGSKCLLSARNLVHLFLDTVTMLYNARVRAEMLPTDLDKLHGRKWRCPVWLLVTCLNNLHSTGRKAA